MNIIPSQSTLQAFGNSVAPTAPAAQVKQPVAAEPVERPAPNVTQRADAAPRPEGPARPDAEGRPPAEASPQSDRPGSRINLLV